MFQPSIGLLSGDWGDDFQIAEGGHLKQSRLGLSKANRFNFRGKKIRSHLNLKIMKPVIFKNTLKFKK